MKKGRVVFASLLAATLLLSEASAEERGMAREVVRVNVPKLALYAAPNKKEKIGEIARDAVPPRMQILDIDGSFYRIAVDDKKVWIRSVQVSVSRSVSGGCLAQASARVPTAGARGVNLEEQCQ